MYNADALAFPSQPVSNSGEPNEPAMGLTIRDYFAAQIASGLMGNRAAFDRADRRLELVAQKAYELADVMLDVKEEYDAEDE